MTICKECGAVESDTLQIIDEREVEVCKVCGMEDCFKRYDDDILKELMYEAQLERDEDSKNEK